MDLGLLVALDALLTEGSVARAAARMNLSAPAMSRTLARIREETGDPILVRAGRGLVPTPRAEAMRERVRTLVMEAQALLGPERIDLAGLQRRFTIRTGLPGSLAAPLLAALRAEAPRVTVRFVAEGDESVDALRDGTLDLQVGVIGATGPEVRIQTLYHDRFVGAVRRGHPLLDGPITADRFAGCDHISASRRGRERGPIDGELEKLGLTRSVPLVVSNHLAALQAAAQSDLVAAVPDSIARPAVSAGLAVELFTLPVAPPPVAVAQAWHPRLDADPAHRFLRGAVLSVTRRFREPAGG